MTDKPINENEFIAYAGGDALKWAQAFRQKASDLGYGDLDEGWLIGWFANAIEAGKAPLVRERDRLRELIEEIAGTATGDDLSVLHLDIADVHVGDLQLIGVCQTLLAALEMRSAPTEEPHPATTATVWREAFAAGWAAHKRSLAAELPPIDRSEGEEP